MEDKIVSICIVRANAEIFDKHLRAAVLIDPKLKILNREDKDGDDCITYEIEVNNLSALWWLGRDYQLELTKQTYNII
jgi:hypothetical protein